MSAAVSADDTVNSVSLVDSDMVVSSVDDPASFDDLSQAISSATDNTVELNNKTYIAAEGGSTIEITTDGLTIYGGTASDDKVSIIDGKNLIQMLSIGNDVKKITFININFVNGFSTNNAGAVLVGDGTNATFINCKFINNSVDGGRGQFGGAIYAGGTSFVNLTNCEFKENKDLSPKGRGGAIYLNSGIINNTLFVGNIIEGGGQGGAIATADSEGTIFIYNSLFVNNTAEFQGGAIFGGHYTVINIIGSNFTNNRANGDGGAIYSFEKVNIVNASFINNTAGSNGGAIAATENNVVYIINTTFKYNNASTAGGAIRAATGSVVTIRNCTFVDDNAYKGGAIAAFTNCNIVISDSNFTHNNATDGDGGAIYAQDYVNVTVTKANFYDNTAYGKTGDNGRGGAIYVFTGSSVEVSESKFVNNSALVWGGAIASATNSNARIINSTFVNNTAVRGGAIRGNVGTNATIIGCYFENNTASDIGGAISLYEDSDANITDTVFKTNSADDGGAIFINVNSFLILNNCTFISNEASNETLSESEPVSGFGGALFVEQDAQAVINNSKFISNNANRGGAIDGYINADITIENTVFTSNVADGYAGAIGVSINSTLTLVNASFVNNTAIRGGAIRGDQNATIVISNSKFANNSATVSYAGAIAGSINTNIKVINSTLVNNSAKLNGGAIRGDVNSTITVEDSKFINNTAEEYAGAIAGSVNTTIKVTNTTFENNLAKTNGGAIRGDLNSTIIAIDSKFINNTANGYAGAIAGYQNTTITVSSSRFENNSCTENGGAVRGDINSTINIINSEFSNNKAQFGGAVAGNDNATITVTGSTFANHTTIRGAAVRGASNSNIIIDNSTFINNAANRGGAISCNENTTITVSNSKFIGNKAFNETTDPLAGDGGAIVGYLNSVVTVKNVTFINNTAEDYGGCIRVFVNATLNVIDSTFVNNSAGSNGGAIRGNENSTINIDNSKFFNNTAKGYAGAVAGYENTVVTVSGSTFENNTCSENGGAIRVDINSTVTVKDSVFTNNSAQFGGSIAGYQNTTITVTGSNFTDNSAERAAAIRADVNSTIIVDNSKFINNVANRGGAIRGDQNTTIVISNSEFIGNKANNVTGSILDGDGGAVVGYINSNIEIINTTFINNSADDYGGAIRVSEAASVKVTDSTFINNTAGSNGGAIRGDANSTITVINSKFFNNTAKAYAGAIAGYQNTTITVSGSRFENNSCTENGGAVRADINSTIVIKDSEFTNNKAQYGGAVAGNDYTTITVTGSTFTNHTTVRGAALRVASNSHLIVDDSIFTDNAANRGGAISSNENSTIKVSNSKFIGNKALNASGDPLAGDGGAIVGYLNSYVEINNSTFINNSADDYGGCIRVFVNATLKVVDSTFINNSAVSNGGALRGNENSTIISINSTFINNKAEHGGAIAGSVNAVINVTGSIFENNDACCGGAVRGDINSSIIVDKSKFINNTAAGTGDEGHGGAIGGYSNTTITITNSEFKDNKGQRGGAVRGDVNSSIDIENSTFTNNVASLYGGAITGYVNSTIAVRGSTFVNNRATAGGAITSWADLNLDDSEFTDNSASDFGSAIFNVGGGTIANSKFTESGSTGVATIYLSPDGDEAVTLNKNTIDTNLIPIFNNGTVIASPVTIVILNNETKLVEKGEIVLNASLYDDNNNVIGSNETVVLDINDLSITGITTTFNATSMQYESDKVDLTQGGNYLVTGEYHKGTNVTVKTAILSIDVKATNLTIVIDDKSFGKRVNGTVTLTTEDGTPLGGAVTVKVGDKSVDVTVTNGVGTLVISNLAIGEYNASAIYQGTDEHAAAQATTIFNVLPITTNVTIAIDNVEFGEPITGTVTLKDAEGNALNGEVTVTIDGVDTTVTVTNGEGTFTINQPIAVADNIEATVKYEAVDQYAASENSTVFNVTKIATTVEVTVKNITYGNVANITIGLTDSKNNKLNGTVEITVNGETIAVTVVDGKGNVTVADLDAGNYTIVANYAATENYTASTASANFSVAQVTTTLTIDVNNTIYGQEGNVVITLVDENGNKLNANAVATITGVDLEIPPVEIVNGTGSFKTPANLDANNYTVVVTYEGNKNYAKANASANFSVAKADVNVTVSISDIYYGDNLTGTITLTANGTPIDGNVTLKVGEDITVVVNVINGTADFNIANELVKGNYTAEVAYNGTKNYNAANSSAKFNVTSLDVFINITIPNVYVGENATGTITAIGAKGELINGKVEVTVGTWNAIVDIVNGTGNFTVTDLEEGTYDVEVKFNATEVYKEATNSTEFNVTKMDVIIDIDVPDVSLGEDVTGTITVTDAKGNPLNTKVNVTVGNWTDIVDIVNGTGEFTVEDLPADTYNVVVKLNGTETYKEAVNETNVTVKKLEAIMNVTIPDVFIGENATGTITLTTEDGTGLDANITVTVNGEEIPVEIVNGTGNFTIGELAEGSYDVNVLYNGTDVYAPINVTKSFKVNNLLIVDVEDLVMYFHNGSGLNVTVTYEGQPIVGKRVQFVINGETYNRTTDENGVARYKNIGLPVGEYVVTIIYENVTKNVTVTVLSTISSDDMEMYFRNGSKFNAEFIDGQGNIINGESVRFNINGEIYNRKVTNGTTSGLAINLNPGKYVITAINDVTGEMKSFNITILSTIIADNLTMYFRNGSKFNAEFLDGKGNLLNGSETKAKFNINGVIYDRTVNENGTTSGLNLNLNPGEYIITVIAPNGEMASFTIVILPDIIAEDFTTPYLAGLKYTAIALDGHGNPQANVTLTFNINGIIYNRTTNVNGTSGGVTINLMPGEYIMTVMREDTGAAVSKTVTVTPAA